MRFKGLALAASAFVFAACGGSEEAPASDTGAAAAPAAAPAASSGSATMAPATGQTHEVKMIGDDKGYRFEPANITIKQGDAVKFTFVSGGPHNVSFHADSLPAGSAAQLDANMGDQRLSELMSNMYQQPGEGITISFANLPAGRYPFNCTPHIAMNMVGVITVQ